MPSLIRNLLISAVSRLRITGCVIPIAVKSCKSQFTVTHLPSVTGFQQLLNSVQLFNCHINDHSKLPLQHHVFSTLDGTLDADSWYSKDQPWLPIEGLL